MYCKSCNTEWKVSDWEKDDEKECPSCGEKGNLLDYNDMAVLLNTFRVLMEEKEMEDAPHGYGIKFISDMGSYYNTAIDTSGNSFKEVFEDLVVHLFCKVRDEEITILEWDRPGVVYINSIDSDDENGYLMISKLPFGDADFWG
ncbi:MAG: hypothetical protein EOO46_16090 [Flavobacterium sp.]|nr:MAG: hypothetical protein EOO46_16090 [Flavobacterium sp.]